MTEKKIEGDDLSKALNALQNLAKGHGSRGTATTEVVGMVGESGATQVFHTASNSDPRSWAGSTWESEDWTDSIGPDGTDYKSAGAGMRKSVLEKVAKGATLTSGERNFVAKGGLDKFNFGKKDDDKDEDKDEKKVEKAMDEAEDKKELAAKKGDMNKSFLDHSVETPAVQRGFEVSEFLAGFAQVMHKSMSSVESRITDRVLTAIARTSAESSEVSTAMAKALSGLGEVLAAQQQRLDQVDSAPARGPKSALSKSINDEVSETLSKSQVSGALFELVTKGQATAQDVIKYDSTGELSNDLRAKIAGRR